MADGAAWQHVQPGCRAVLVFGSGGTALWQVFTAWVAADPTRAALSSPLNQFVAESVAALPGDPARRWVRCADDDVMVDFRTLAREAGLGHPSRLGLLLHPTYGPWLGLRAACFTTDPLPVTGALAGPAPCDGCPAPCEAACPAGAIGPDGWAFDPCLAWQRRETTCQGGCLARSACVAGTTHAYGSAQHRYHQHPPSRQAVLAALSPAGRGTDRSS